MSALRVGATLPAKHTEAMHLPGRWSVWSQAAEAPGAYFLAPADDAALAAGLKYVVIKALMGRSAVEPTLSLLRTDPHDAALIAKNTETKNKKGSRR